MLSKNKISEKKKYRTGLYYRLSKEDGDKIESDSISNQRLIIKNYLKGRDEFCVVDEYIDDGYSGANFDRPDFTRLYEDLKTGAVNCVIVKDLSRFGRNYIEVGRYLERLFPMMGVRLIAINDNYDGEAEKKNSDAITIPVKNLMNDVYCREMSTKVKTLLDAKRKRGDCVSNFVPYGYKKSLKNRSKLEIDEDAAEIVRQIIVWKMEGVSDQGIADNLNNAGILSPLEYRLEAGQHFTENFKRNGTAVWNSKSVYRILHCETYTGTMVQGKNKKIDYRSKNIVRMPEKNWVRVADMHPAIIDKETYDKVQTLLLKDTRVAPGENSVSILSGFVECGDCHGKMVYRTSNWKNKKYFYMICKTYKTDRSCSTHNISADKLYEIVLNEIRAQAEIAVRLELEIALDSKIMNK